MQNKKKFDQQNVDPWVGRFKRRQLVAWNMCRPSFKALKQLRFQKQWSIDILPAEKMRTMYAKYIELDTFHFRSYVTGSENVQTPPFLGPEMLRSCKRRPGGHFKWPKWKSLVRFFVLLLGQNRWRFLDAWNRHR